MNEIEKLFNEHKISVYASIGDRFMLPYLTRHLGYGVLMYGAGNMAMASLKYMKDVTGIMPEFIVDASPKCTVIDNIPVINVKEFEKMKKNKKYCAVVSNSFFTCNNDEKLAIGNMLSINGIDKIIDIYSDVCAIIKNNWYVYLNKNKGFFVENYDLFEDKISKDTYYHFLKAIIEGHEYQGRTFSEQDKYFASEEDSRLYNHLSNEKWINMGSYRGDTIYHFINNGFDFDKIYAIEGDKDVLGTLERNLSFLPNNIRKKIEVVPYYFGLDAKKLDDYFRKEEISLINMDIEGTELEALKSAEKLIQASRPVLAVCVYHRPEDLLKIPNYISSIVNEYAFYLRKYPSLRGGYYDGMYCVNEFVLYAIPKERRI